MRALAALCALSICAAAGAQPLVVGSKRFTESYILGEILSQSAQGTHKPGLGNTAILLEALKSETGVRMFGMNQKDAPENAVAFLTELGNHYDAIGADANGRASIDWGVYGVPETFIVDAKGTIRFKHVGPLSMDDLAKEIIPAIERAKS